MRVNRKLSSYHDQDYDAVDYLRHRLKRRSHRHDEYPKHRITGKYSSCHSRPHRENDLVERRSSFSTSKRKENDALNYRQTYSRTSGCDRRHYQTSKIDINEPLSANQETITDHLLPADVYSNVSPSNYIERESNRYLSSPSSTETYRRHDSYLSSSFYKNSSRMSNEYRSSISPVLAPLSTRKTADAYNDVHRTTNEYSDRAESHRIGSSHYFYSTPSMEHSDSMRMSLSSSSSSNFVRGQQNERSETDYRTRNHEITIPHKEEEDRYDNDDEFYHPSYQDRSSLKRFRSNIQVYDSRRSLRR